MNATLRDLLAAYRLTRVVIDDSRDFPPLKLLREEAEMILAGSPWAEVLECPWCASFWVGLAVLVLRRCCPRVWDAVGQVLAWSAAAGLLRMAEEVLAKAGAADTIIASRMSGD